MFNLFLKPVITEKATALQAEGKYQFFVRSSATKVDIKTAFERLYGVDVVKVNAMRTERKTRMGARRQPVTKKPAYKKVTITVKAKKSIDINKPKLKF